mmetsp:Transcript_37315/g.107822  ORF Transcript_37315/g.107822 Transcript_37315/m.107822 type:complete len:208 (-) Transcript_37315:335-958(-)
MRVVRHACQDGQQDHLPDAAVDGCCNGGHRPAAEQTGGEVPKGPPLVLRAKPPPSHGLIRQDEEAAEHAATSSKEAEGQCFPWSPCLAVVDLEQRQPLGPRKVKGLQGQRRSHSGAEGAQHRRVAQACGQHRAELLKCEEDTRERRPECSCDPGGGADADQLGFFNQRVAVPLPEPRDGHRQNRSPARADVDHRAFLAHSQAGADAQ